jgi:hypothetical protein
MFLTMQNRCNRAASSFDKEVLNVPVPIPRKTFVLCCSFETRLGECDQA